MNQSANNPRSTPAESWFVATQSGAVEYCLDALKREIECGGVHSNTLVWRKGMQEWVQLDQVPLLRMLVTVKPSPGLVNSPPFVTSGAPVSNLLSDEQFEDETTVFRRESEVADTAEPAERETQASVEISGAAVDPPSAPETSAAAQSTSVFDGLFEPLDAGVTGEQGKAPIADVAQTTEPGSAPALNQLATKAEAVATAAATPTPDVGTEPTTPAPTTAATGTNKADESRTRRTKPDSVPRRKTGSSGTARPVLTRPATPRVSIAGLSTRTLDSKPAFQLPKHEPLAEGYARNAPSTLSASAGRSEPVHALALDAARPRVAPETQSPTLSSRTKELWRAEHSVPTSTQPIVLPLPMPALPPPPRRVEPSTASKETQIGKPASGLTSSLEPMHPSTALETTTESSHDAGVTSSASVGKAEVRPPSVGKAEVRPPSVGNAEVKPSSVGNAEVRPPSVGNAEVKPSSVGNAEVQPSVIVQTASDCSAPPEVEQLAAPLAGSQIAPNAQALEGDSLFPSASSIHPALFRPNKSRRTLLLVGSFGVAAVATFAIVMATQTTPEAEAPIRGPTVGSTQDRASSTVQANPVAEHEQTAAGNSPPAQAPGAALSTTPGKDPVQPQSVAAHTSNAAPHLADTRKSSASGVGNAHRTRTARPGAVAIAASNTDESSPPAVDKSESWERGTVEKRAWMEPGF